MCDVQIHVYVSVCLCMWCDICEPNHMASRMVHDSYVGVCGAYVGVCGRVCVNQIVVYKKRRFACMWERMWAYVGRMWVYVGCMLAYVGVCWRMLAYVTYESLGRCH